MLVLFASLCVCVCVCVYSFFLLAGCACLAQEKIRLELGNGWCNKEYSFFYCTKVIIID